MRIKPLVLISIALWGVLLAGTGYSQSPVLRVKLPDIAAPPGADWHWVASRMTFNGVAMTIKMFDFYGTADEVESYYSDLWYSMGHGTRSSRNLGLIKVMSFEQRGNYITVQFEEEGSWVRGKIVVTESPTKRRPDYRTTLPVPPGGRVVNVIESLDQDKHTESVTIESSRAIDFNLRFFQNQLKSRGFASLYIKPSADGLGLIGQFQNGSQLLQINIKNPLGNHSSNSHILIHLTK